jgi:Domain of unknown function (DUF1929)
VLAIIVAVTRRDFLKIMGASASVFVFGSLSGFALLNNNNNNNKRSATTAINEAEAQTAGSWTSGQNTSTVAIHASLLPNGRIFYLAGSGYHASHQNGPFEARILNPDTGSESSLSQSQDLFCAGQAPLPNGNILLSGGTLRYDIAPDNCNGKWHGLSSAYELDWSSGSLTRVASMRHGRWYPTCVTLPDGNVMVTGGYDEYGDHNRNVEIYNSSSKSWTIRQAPSGGATYIVGNSSASICAGAGQQSYSGASANLFLYPRMHLMPSGNIVVAGMLGTIRIWNSSTGSWSSAGTMSPEYRHYGTSVLLPLNNTTSERGKILTVGGSPTSAATAITSCQILDFNTGSPSIRTVGSLASGRKYLAPVILPDGKVVVFGGSAGPGNQNPRLTPEMFNPATESWTSLASASVPRVYHQVALLLPDGRIWTAGSTPVRSTWELRTEFFRPSYYTATRPAISGAPTVGDYGASITIPTSAASSITMATLVKCPDTTHHYDANMRHLTLAVQSRTSSSVTVEAPLNANLAPHGYYMIHVLNSAGIPSIARIIQIPGSGSGGGGGDTTPPSKVLGLTPTATSESQIDLNWTANTEPDLDHYNIYRGTTANFAVNTATDTPLATPATNSYSDTGLTASTTYYYKVAAVDTSNNIGALSDEASATTSSGGGGVETFYDVPSPGNAVGGIYTGASTRYGEEARTSASVLVGKSLKNWTVRLKRAGSPSGTVRAVVRSSSDAIVATFNETINASSLPTSFTEQTFTLTNAYTIAAGDRILVEYSGPARVDIDVWATDQIDGSITRRVRYDGTSYIGGNTADVVGTMSS